MTESELKSYYEAYTDCWKMFRKFSNPVSDNSFWDELTHAADLIYKKHGNSEFVKGLVLSTVLEIEKIYQKATSHD